MKSKMKNRIALLSILLVAGLLMTVTGTALGAGKLLKFTGKQVSASVITNENGTNVLTVKEGGKVVKELTLPKGKYTYETSDGKIVIGKMTKEDMEKHQAEAKANKNEFLEIAKKDSRVQELIDGKDYKVVGMSTSGTDKGETETAILVLKVEGKYYKITIDLNSEKVKSIEEQTSGRIDTCYGPGCK